MNSRFISLAASAALVFTATAAVAAPRLDRLGRRASLTPAGDSASIGATAGTPTTMAPMPAMAPTVPTSVPLTPPTSAAPPRSAPATIPTTIAGSDPINFIGQCAFSHAAPDDPIVKMNMAGMSHMHDFFGNTSTNAASTYESMLASGTTCRRSGEKAGYWVPAMYQNGVKVQPVRMSIYYFNGQLPNASIRPFPAGLKLVAGTSTATAPQGSTIVSWSCDVPAGTTLDSMSSETPPNCPTGRNLKAHVKFPNCWDGVNLDSADHKSHLAYAFRGACPGGYPVAVPKIQLNIFYPITGDPSGLTLASGSVNSMHGDFFNTWVQSELERLVNACIVPDIHCDANF